MNRNTNAINICTETLAQFTNNYIQKVFHNAITLNKLTLCVPVCFTNYNVTASDQLKYQLPTATSKMRSQARDVLQPGWNLLHNFKSLSTDFNSGTHMNRKLDFGINIPCSINEPDSIITKSH